MKQNKKNLKGFTLVELIVVMAVFSIILLVVMSLVDPVARIMNQTSAKEKSAAYIDNIEDYMESSMKYAKFIRVYEGDFCDISGNQLTEEQAVESFVNAYFDGYIDENHNLVSGKVRVLKLCNDPITTPSGDVYFGNGEIVETVWNFTAGDTYTKEEPDPTDPTKTIKVPYTKTLPVVSESEADMLDNPEKYMVINPEHFEKYSYFYKLGYNSFNAVPDDVAEDYGAAVSSDEEFYYSEINQGKNLGGGDVPFGQDNFGISVVAYENGNMLELMVDDDGDATTPNVEKNLFRSPAYMNNSSMALLNVINASNENQASYFQIKQDEYGNSVLQDGKEVLEKTSPKSTPFFYYDVDAIKALSDNIYFVYALPSELSF